MQPYHRLPACALIAMLLLAAAPPLQAQPLGVFEGHGDVGAAGLPGRAAFDAATGAYTLEGAGSGSDRDAFHLAWKRMTGDFILTARAHFDGDGAGPHRKLGWTVRAGLDADAAHASAAVHGDGLASLQFRRTRSAQTEEIKSTVAAPDVVQLARTGNTYTLSVARFGEPFVSEEVTDLALGDAVYVGLFISAHREEAREKAVFRDVRITVPAPDSLVAYRQYLGSNLEILDVETGHREIVHRAPDSFQAPNWTPDGKALIYNHNGLLYRFDLETRTPAVLPTGFADRNNNDHVLTFDGRMLGISHHPPDEGHSIIYTVPVEGGTPKRITPLGPSYLHGWSPDNRYLVYTAQRDGDYDIYRIPADGSGPEERLTFTPGLDDGSEYSPDGRHIYYNSVRSGTMQLWRMTADGEDHTQLTDDGFNNWFPHVSPDGRWILFLSYLPDVPPGDHPFYKPVYLRLMPVGGGPARVVAYLYGGQGTINVPSWSPDSKRAAFVSNTGR